MTSYIKNNHNTVTWDFFHDTFLQIKLLLRVAQFTLNLEKLLLFSLPFMLRRLPQKAVPRPDGTRNL